jgi:hypothetical protein
MPMGKFNNPIVGAGNTLIRAAIRSVNYVAGLAGWSINFDGTAEFTSLTSRGTFQSGPTSGAHVTMTSSGLFVYRSNGTLMFAVNTSSETVFFYDDTGTEYAHIDPLDQLSVTRISNFNTGDVVQFTDTTTRNPVNVRNGNSPSFPFLYGESGTQSFTFTANSRVSITVNLANTQPNATYVVIATVDIGSNLDILFNLQTRGTTSFTGTLFTRGLGNVSGTGRLHWTVMQALT